MQPVYGAAQSSQGDATPPVNGAAIAVPVIVVLGVAAWIGVSYARTGKGPWVRKTHAPSALRNDTDRHLSPLDPLELEASTAMEEGSSAEAAASADDVVVQTASEQAKPEEEDEETRAMTGGERPDKVYFNPMMVMRTPRGGASEA